MKYAILGDIHGNSVALNTVIEDIRRNKIGKLLLTGDFVGYYYHPQEVFTALHSWDWLGVKGNHDLMLEQIAKGKISEKFYKKKYGSSLKIALATLDKHQKQTLFSQPVTRTLLINNSEILLCHGSPWKVDEYIYPDAREETFNKFLTLGRQYVILGHTHYPFIKKTGTVYILNPGSVGQPRDFGSRASWMEADFTKNHFILHRVDFDPASLIQEALHFDPQLPYLRSVLLRNRSFSSFN